ncbi:MAG: glycosyltransferase [Acidimicrobiales bacterium]|nr:glycosyltransferase [Acidimicrobiales bacterium]
MRILMVSPYPPLRDGIATYAVQAVAALRAAGHDVEVLSPGPSAAHHHLDLLGPRGALALAKRVRSYDRVIIQFHPDLFYRQPATAKELVGVSAALTAAFRAAPDLEVQVHEVDYRLGRGHGPVAVAMRGMWRSVPRILLHTDAERAAFLDAFRVPGERVHLSPHGEHFTRRTSLDRVEARRRFGIPPEEFMFLSIGFIQPHKGFDRALRAFGDLGALGCRLDIVGSVRVEDPAYVEHLDELRRLAGATPGATLHTGYVSDEEFDRWLVATDVVVLPYRHIWSSGVVERAALYGRPVVASRVGGLEAQARPGTVLVDDDEGLRRAMREIAGRLGPDESGHGPGWVFDGDAAAEDVLAEVRARATARRGGNQPVSVTAARTAPKTAGASAPLRRLSPLAPAAPSSARAGAGLVKRTVRRLTGWEIDPIVEHVNRLQRVMVDAIEERSAEDGKSSP